MNSQLVVIGVLCSLIWALVTGMSLGLPLNWCEALDNVTGHVMSDSILRMANGFYYDVDNNDMPTIMFLFCFFVVFALMFYCFCRIEKGGTNRTTLWIVLGFAVLFRIIVLPGELIHENDIYRYMWDGKTLLKGINPYKYAPADLFMVEHEQTQDFYDHLHDVTIPAKDFSAAELRQVDVLIEQRYANPDYYDRIGHWEVPTIYPPLMQGLFVLPMAIQPDAIILMKAVFVLFDIGVILVIMGLLKHFQKDPSLCILYAWSPLVLKEFANAGHYDPVVIFFTLLGLYLFVKHRDRWAGVSLSLAVLTKFFALVLLPILWRHIRKSAFLWLGLIVVIAYVPFVLMDHTGIKGVFQGFLTYNRLWSYNGSVFAVIYALLKQIHPPWVTTLYPANTIAGLLYVGFLGWLAWRCPRDDRQILHHCFWAVAVLFIINPVGDPWYFCWTIPFLCLFPYRSWILLSGLLVLAYLNFRDDIAWVDWEFFHIPGLHWIIYVPFFIFLVWEMVFAKRRQT